MSTSRDVHAKQPAGLSRSLLLSVPEGPDPHHSDMLLVCVCAFVRVFQELTEEGIPFLILFHVKEDTDSLEQFQHEVARQLISEKGA